MVASYNTVKPLTSMVRIPPGRGRQQSVPTTTTLNLSTVSSLVATAARVVPMVSLESNPQNQGAATIHRGSSSSLEKNPINKKW